MMYSLWVGCGIVAAFIIARWQPPDRSDLDEGRQRALLIAGVLGAVAGAYGLEIPADLWGWAWRPATMPGDALPLGGRTVLGGLLGGWLTVEAVKWRLGISGATGDRFALPLAVALACGRLGCASAGCCAGQASEAWWAWQGCVPVQLIEAVFHALAALLLLVAIRRRWAMGRRLAIYLTAYAALRFVLEWQRGNPPILWSLTWYQFLAIALLLIAGSTWARRAWMVTVPR